MPRLSQPALTALIDFIVYSSQFFGKGHFFLSRKSGIGLLTLINTQPSSPFLAWPSFRLGLLEAPTNEELGSFLSLASFPGPPPTQPGC